MKDKILKYLFTHENLFVILASGAFMALFVGVIALVITLFCKGVGYVNNQAETRMEKEMSYLVEDPRTVNDDHIKWITIPYNRNENHYNTGYINFTLDDTTYSTKRFFIVKKRNQGVSPM